LCTCKNANRRFSCIGGKDEALLPKYEASIRAGPTLVCPFIRGLCTTANDPPEMSKRVTNVILAVLADVGYAPVSVGNSDIADVGEVPKATKVHCSKIQAVRSPR
jgi:hypothetical protein